MEDNHDYQTQKVLVPYQMGDHVSAEEVCIPLGKGWVSAFGTPERDGRRRVFAGMTLPFQADLLCQEPNDVPALQPADSDGLPAADSAPLDSDAALAHAKKTAQKSDQFLVSLALHRRRGNFHMQYVVTETDNLVPAGIRVNVDSNARPFFRHHYGIHSSTLAHAAVRTRPANIISRSFAGGISP